MEFFENQVGEVRYLTTLPRPPDSAPPIPQADSSSSPTAAAAAAAASITNAGNNGEPSSATTASPHHQAPPVVPSMLSYSRQSSDANHIANTNSQSSRTEKKPRKQSSIARRDTGTSSMTPAAGGAGSTSTPAAGSVAGTKRKTSGDDMDEEEEESVTSRPGPQQRSKRNRYISIACNECKRRKIKCNGETPCGRCGHLNLQCLYAPNCCASSVKDSEEFKQVVAQVSHLQEQVEVLFNNLNSLRSETLRTGISHQPHERSLTGPSASSTPTSTTMTAVPPPPRQPPSAFRGPTSNHFSLDVAKNTLHKMGYSYPGDSADTNGNAHETPHASPKLGPLAVTATENTTADVLWELSKDEMIRLCRIYEEEVGIMYPVLRIDTIISHARTLATWMEAAKKSGLAPPSGGQDGGINDLNTLTLKVVLCGGLLVEGHGSSLQAQRIFGGIKHIANRMLMSDPPNVQNLPFLALVAGFYFLSADEVLCWRVMGQVLRLCLELGLHRRDVIDQIRDEDERWTAVNTFWSVYVLDRRWAFSAGLPYVVSDEEIDPDLPSPEQHPFLMMMIAYSKLSARVWRFVRQLDYENLDNVEAPLEDIEHLDQAIKKWYTELPQEVQLELSDWDDMPQYLSPPAHSPREYDIQRLQIWTWLRFNQIRLWLHTPILHTHSSIMDNLRHAEVGVKLAKNTIRYLAHLNNTTNVYRKMQIFYHQFLSSAITILFVASCHAPVNFSSSCRDEFYMALDLLKDMSAKSWVSKRLWSTVKSLRDVAPRLGLAEDPHSSAALTMAGLAAGHQPSPSTTTTTTTTTCSPFGPPPIVPTTPAYDVLQNGLQMSSEMSRIFEGVSGRTHQVHTGLGAHADPNIVNAATTPTPIFGGPRYQSFRSPF
ncbi:hypothetical protein F5Y17DRAFT_383138 [Xylariaceae sp. FL0594]|nr:hypothetical protein F5Y17DRAFT_383138 [Xylariaceae sp. FL0594]